MLFLQETHFMIHFSGQFEGASTFLTPKLSLEMANKVIVLQKSIMSRSFLNRGTLIVIYFNVVVCILMLGKGTVSRVI